MPAPLSASFTRRQLLGASGAGAAALFLSACSSSGSGGGGGNGSDAFTWFMWSGSTQEVAAWKHVAAMVTEKVPSTKITFQTAAWNDYWTKLTSQAASGGSADIVGIQSLRAPQFNDMLVPLDQYLSADDVTASDFDASIYDGLTVDGKVKALPYDFGPYVIFYNKTAFAAAGLPEPAVGWTRADFMTAAHKLTSGSKYGFFASPGIDAAMPFVLSDSGKQAVDSSGKLDIDNDAWAQTLSWYRSLITTEKVAAPIPSTSSSAAATNQFLAGNAAMTIDGPWSLINAKATAKFEVGIAPVPAGAMGSRTMTAGSGFGVSTSCKDPKAAAKAISILTGTDAEAYLGAQGRAFPARTAQQDSWYEGNKVQDAKTVMDYSIKNSVPYATTATWTPINDTYNQYSVTAFNGDSTVADLLKRVQAAGA